MAYMGPQVFTYNRQVAVLTLPLLGPPFRGLIAKCSESLGRDSPSSSGECRGALLCTPEGRTTGDAQPGIAVPADLPHLLSQPSPNLGGHAF